MATEFSLDRSWKKVAFGLAVLLVAVAVVATASRFWLAGQWATSYEPEPLRAAIELDPGNADYYYRLGHFFHLDFTRRDLDQAILFYRRATEIDPRSAEYWTALADTYELVGDVEAAEQAYEKAVHSYPISPAVAWAHGNFHLRRGELAVAFREFRRALSVDPSLARSAFRLCWGATADTELILREAIPADPPLLLTALNYLISLNRLPAAERVWLRLVDLGQRLPLQQTFRYVDALIRAGRTEAAQTAWREALQLGAPTRLVLGQGPAITNGDFEQDLVNGGLGWRYRPAPGATMAYDSAVQHTGSRSLRLTFDGTQDLDFQHLWQYVPVEPGMRYQFEAFLKTEDLSTRSGVRFRIFDPAQPSVLDILTEGLTGTQDWTRQEAEFSPRPSTHLVIIALRRSRTRQLYDRLEGRVWVDGVSLRPVERRNTP